MSSAIPVPRLALTLLPVAYLLLVAAEFLALTHLTLDLTQRGLDALQVGLVVAAFWSGILVATSTAHALARRRGAAWAVTSACSAETLLMVAMAAWPHDGLRLACLAGVGYCGGLLWVCCEAWMAELAPKGRQGVFIGVFETGVGLGMMIGPALLAWLQPMGLQALWVSAHLLLLSLLLFAPLHWLTSGQRPDVQACPVPTAPVPGSVAERHEGLRAMAVMAALAGLMESGVSGVLPSLGLRMDMGLGPAALLGTVVGAGSALLQVPAGGLCDRFGCRRAITLAWLVLLFSNIALLGWGQHSTWLLWQTAFVLGGVGGAVYTLALTQLSRRLRGTTLVQAMSWMITAYCLGTLAGPLVGGWAFDMAGLTGTALALSAFSGAGLALSIRSPQAGGVSRPI